ncbi:unnamed protein product [Amoebophrya sp. A25]|nr:unnamed protein product [Amoebophrya sp. A25]|eukprot:GSA25T00009481001.1
MTSAEAMSSGSATPLLLPRPARSVSRSGTSSSSKLVASSPGDESSRTSACSSTGDPRASSTGNQAASTGNQAPKNSMVSRAEDAGMKTPLVGQQRQDHVSPVTLTSARPNRPPAKIPTDAVPACFSASKPRFCDDRSSAICLFDPPPIVPEQARATDADPTITPASSSTGLALLRTDLANERTFLAWIRTAAGLVTLGFAVDKLSSGRIDSICAVVFVALGVWSAAVGTIRYYQVRRSLIKRNYLLSLIPEDFRIGRIGLRWFISVLGLFSVCAMSLVCATRMLGPHGPAASASTEGEETRDETRSSPLASSASSSNEAKVVVGVGASINPGSKDAVSEGLVVPRTSTKGLLVAPNNNLAVFNPDSTATTTSTTEVPRDENTLKRASLSETRFLGPRGSTRSS